MVILDRDPRQILAAGAKTLEVRRGAQRKPAGRGGGQIAHPAYHHTGTGHAAVLGLVVSHHQHGVVDASGDRHHRGAKRLGSGRAIIGNRGQGFVQLERFAHFHRAVLGVERTAVDRVDLPLGILDTGIGIGFHHRSDDHVLFRLVPVLAEGAAAGAHDGRLIAQTVAQTHASSPPVASTHFQK